MPAPSGLSAYEKLEYLIANIAIMQVTIEAKVDGLVDILVAKGIFTQSDIEVMNSDISYAIEELRTDGVPNVVGDPRTPPG